MGIAAAPSRRTLRLLVGMVAALLCLVAASTSGAAADTTPPTTPTGIGARFSGTDTMLLTWTLSTDNVGVQRYEVSLDGVLSATSAGWMAVITNLNCNQTYQVSIVAFDAAGNHSVPGTAAVTTPACPGTTPPPTPTPTPTPTPAPTPTPPPSSGENPKPPTPTTPPPAPGSPPPPTTIPPPIQPPGPAPTGGTLAVAPSGSDRNSCAPAAPCATFDRAYHQASPGQFVLVAGGSYPSQKITVDQGKTSASKDVVFQPSSGAQVRVAGVAVLGSHLELRNMQTTWHVFAGANGVTFRNVIADSAVFITGGASNVSVLGGQVYSPVPTANDSQIASLNGKVPTNILFDGVAFHDFQDIGPGQLHHIECLQVGAAINLTIRNSSFRNCATHDIFIRSWGMANNSPSPLTNVVIQNNSFAKTTSGYYAMQILDDLWTWSPRTSFFVLNNTAQQSILVRVSNGTAQVRYNNLPSMSAYFCAAYGQKAWFDYNTYAFGTPCGLHDTVTGSTAPAPTPAPAPAPTSTSASTSTSVSPRVSGSPH